MLPPSCGEALLPLHKYRYEKLCLPLVVVKYQAQLTSRDEAVDMIADSLRSEASAGTVPPSLWRSVLLAAAFDDLSPRVVRQLTAQFWPA